MNTFSRFLLCSALLAGAAAATPAFAASIDTFTVINSATTYTFSLPVSPTANVNSVSNQFSSYFDVTNVAISVNGGAATTGTVYFDTISAAGGVGISISTPSTFFNDEGPQLFTYTGTLGQASFAPTFIGAGTYSLYEQNSPTTLAGSVTIGSAAAPAPEPSSLALLGTGVLGLAGLLRRKIA